MHMLWNKWLNYDYQNAHVVKKWLWYDYNNTHAMHNKWLKPI
jgi:hypothetical protein